MKKSRFSNHRIKQMKFRKLVLESFRRVRYIYLQISIIIFWSVALYPGRISYDNVKLLRLIRIGGSTDWWSAEYFWIIKLISINGRYPAIVSLCMLMTLFFSIRKLISSISRNKRVEKISLLIITVTPFFGVFGMTISHDVFFCSGLLLLVSIELNRYPKESSSDVFYPNRLIFTSWFLLATTHIGIVIIIFSLIRYLLTNRKKASVFVILLFLSTQLISAIGIQERIPTYRFLWPLAADIKCVVQHPDADLPSDTWEILTRYSSQENWKKPIPCSNMDPVAVILGDFSNQDISYLEFLKFYVNLASQNPQIVIMSHIQKSQGVLPPPFFSSVTNMVVYDPKKPIGYNSQSSLIVGQEVLHSSIDAPEYKPHSAAIKVLESIALFPVFLINQASWFWGWGGLWFYSIPIYFFRKRRMREITSTYPFFLAALVLVAVSPAPSVRYFMWEVIGGLIFTIILAVEYFSKEYIKS